MLFRRETMEGQRFDVQVFATRRRFLCRVRQRLQIRRGLFVCLFYDCHILFHFLVLRINTGGCWLLY